MAKSSLEMLPVLPLRDMVVYPHGVHPLFVGTESSIRALEAAMADSKKIFLIAKRDSDKSDLEAEDLYALGTVATILQRLKCLLRVASVQKSYSLNLTKNTSAQR